ncbi:MAG: hypothetical protein HN337_06895 [Deltaproteobacteria bacterium]|jgi:membrane-bound metal-dependent hydrolase YbcI (DUF457 family)|nr:hypothetical protein [Deltaproteobacteria bacterium]
MTPIGHFMCASAVAGNIDLTTEKETNLCFAYYGLFLLTFWILSLIFAPGKWAMYVHDQFGNAALVFFLIYWGGKDARRQAFVCLLIGGQVLSAYTHIFDVTVLKLTGEIPLGMWRPHNILHTPMAAFLVPLIFLTPIKMLLRRVSWRAAYFMLCLGYFLHIFADTVTYSYQIYPLWPFNSFHFAVIDYFQRSDAIIGTFLGNPLYIFEKSTKENIDGFIVYKAEVLINVLLAVLFYIKSSWRRISKLES